jgi:methionyl-tRNA formyltransferase
VRALFLGTPDAAVPALRALISVAEIEAVITRPDRPKGRSGSVSPPPVKEAALGAGLTVFQPPTTTELSVLLLDLPPVDVAVVVAFGMLIRPDALAVPGAGFVNVHFSVLPRWRGAAPVQRAIMAGDARTGVTLMRLDAGLDTGPILSTLTTAVAPDEDTPALTRRLAEAGGTLLAEVLSDIVEGRVVAVPQDERAASFAPRIHGDERWLDSIPLEPRSCVGSAASDHGRERGSGTRTSESGCSKRIRATTSFPWVR